MARSAVTLLVCLCFLVSLISADYTITNAAPYATNIANGRLSFQLNADPSITPPVHITVVSNDPTVRITNSPQIINLAGQQATFLYAGTQVGTFVVNVTGATTNITNSPNAGLATQYSVLVEVGANLNMNSGFSLNPGSQYSGTVALTSSPAHRLTVSLNSNPSGLIFNPPSMTFIAGQSPYTQSFVVSSIQPANNYNVSLVYGDADKTSGYTDTAPFYLFAVGLRAVDVVASDKALNAFHVGDTSNSILVFLPIKPDIGLIVEVATSDPDHATVSSTSLTFGPTDQALSFTITAIQAGTYAITFTLAGTDSAKYAPPPTMQAIFSNRTLITPVIPSLVVGIPSSLLTIYIEEVPSTQLTVTFGGNNLVFTPPFVTFTSSLLVTTFQVTANANFVSGTQLTYTLSGTNSQWYSTPAPVAVALTGGLKRTVTPAYGSNFGSGIPVGEERGGNYLRLNAATPSSFIVTLSGPGLTFDPSVITFEGPDDLAASFSVEATTLGSTFINYAISGTDANLVNPIASQAVTVNGGSSGYNSLPTLFAGVPGIAEFALSTPVTSDMTITFSATSPTVTITPSTFSLADGDSEVQFTLLSTTLDAFALLVTFGGSDAAYYIAPNAQLLQVSPIQIVTQLAPPPSGVHYTVGIPTLLNVHLNPATTTLSVTVTPFSASSLFTFSPASVTLTGQEEACFTVVPVTSSVDGSDISFVLSNKAFFTSSVALDSIAMGSFTVSPTSLEFFVGLTSNPVVVSLPYAPSGPIILVPEGGDMTFNPTSLTFDADHLSQSFTVTSDEASSDGPYLISWNVSGAGASAFSPLSTISVTVDERQLSSPSAVNQIQGGLVSDPITLTAFPPPPNGLTITPSSPGLVFQPATLTLKGETAGFFTATVENLADITTFVILYSLSGPDADWYPVPGPTVLSATPFGSITITAPATGAVTAGVPSSLGSVTLSVPAVNGLTISICAVAGLTLIPAELQFAPGATVAQYSLLVDDNTITPITITWVLSGPDADLYHQPGTTSVSVTSDSVFEIWGLGEVYYLEPFPIEIYYSSAVVPDDFEVTITPVSDALTFTPATYTFNSTLLHLPGVVVANKVPQLNQGYTTVTLLASGNYQTLWTVQGPTGVYVDQIYLNIGSPGFNDLGDTVIISASTYIPPSSQLVLTPVPSEGLTISPSSVTFTPQVTQAFFELTPTLPVATIINWELSGPDAPFYSTPGVFSFSPAGKKNIYLPNNNVYLTPSPSFQVVQMYTDEAPITGITLTPVLPEWLSITPSVIKFGPGVTDEVLYISAKNMAFEGYFTGLAYSVSFALGGPDAASFNLNSLPVLNVRLSYGDVDIQGTNTLNGAVVGLPTQLQLILDLAPPNGFTLIPSGNGIVFDPAQIEFAAGQTWAAVTFTITTVGQVYLVWTLAGPDAQAYYALDLPTSAYSNSRNVEVTLGNNYYTPGIPYFSLVSLDYPPANDLTVTITSSCLTSSPAKFTFAAGIASLMGEFTLTEDCAGYYNQFSYAVELSGTDVAWYSGPSGTVWGSSQMNTAITDSTIYVANGLPSAPLAVVLSAPGDITITLSAPGCVFSPSQLVFDDTTSALLYTVSCAAAGPISDSVPISYVISGDDAALYQWDGTPTIYRTGITVTVPQFNSLETALRAGQPFPTEVYISAPPPSPVTLTPISKSFTFEPATVTFDGTDAFFTIMTTPITFGSYDSLSDPLPLIIDWSITEVEGVAIPNPTTQFYVAPSYVFVEGDIEFPIGTEAGPLTYYVDPVPLSDLTVTPDVDGCTFTPSSFAFGPTSTVVSASVTCTTIGPHILTYALSGTDANYYIVDQDDEIDYVEVEPATIGIYYEATNGPVFAENWVEVYLPFPAVNGLTLTPAAAGFTFEPSSVTFAAGNAYALLEYYATELTGPYGSPVIWTLSGPDAAWYLDPTMNENGQPVFLTANILTVNVPYLNNLGPIVAGAPTNAYAVTLENPPSQQLIVTPIGAGLTFDPPSLTFGPTDYGLSFTVQAEIGANFLNVYYSLSGADAEYYVVDYQDTNPVETQLISLNMQYNDNPFVGVQTTVLFSVNNPPSSAVTVSLVGSGVQLSPSSFQITPDDTLVVFTFTPQVVGDGNIYYEISGDAATEFSSTDGSVSYTSRLREFFLPGDMVPNLWAGVQSAPLAVSVRRSPPTGVTITPSAPATVFVPATLTFGPTTTSVEFRMTSQIPAEENPQHDSYNKAFTVSWSVSGPDADWYDSPDEVEFYPRPRDLQLVAPTLPQGILIGVPQTITFTTTYPPTTGLTILPHGPFTFSPSSFVFAPNQTAASITITSQIQGNYPVSFTLSGADAAYYEQPSTYSVQATLWSFEIPDFSDIVHTGLLAAPLTIRTIAVPTANVTLTLVSGYLEFFPSTLTFSPTSPSAVFTFGLRGLGYLDVDSFVVSFFVGGPAADLFRTPSDVNIPNDVNQQYQIDLDFEEDDSSVIVGVPEELTLTLPHPPLGSITLTPSATSPDVVITPASFTIKRGDPLVATFVLTAKQPTGEVYVNFAITGSDAAYYAPVYAFFSVDPRWINMPEFPDMKVGIPTYPLTISLPYATPNSLTVIFYSDGITFTPNTFTFTPANSIFTFIATGTYVSGAVTVHTLVTGTDAAWYDSYDNWFTLTIDERGWSHTNPSDVVLTAGVPHVISYSLDTPPNAYILITPTAAGVTFTPATLNISSPASSGWFSVVGTAAGTYSEVEVSVTGPDAIYYPPLEDYEIDINPLNIHIETGLGGDTEIQVGDVTGFVLRLDAAALQGLYVTPGAAGLTFVPASLYFPPGAQYAHGTFTASITPGPTQVFFSVSGPDSILFNQNTPLHSHIVVNHLSISYSTDVYGEIGLPVGSTSPMIYVISSGSDDRQLPPPQPVTLNFVVSPAGSVVVNPPNITFLSYHYADQIQVTANFLSDEIFVQPVLSGPGAIFYNPPSALKFYTYRRTFNIDSFYNYLLNPLQYQFALGSTVGPFAVTADSVVTDIALNLSAPGLKFIPSVLRFTGTFETLYFKILALETTVTYITYSISGNDAPWFETPSPSGAIRVTPQFTIPDLPSVVIGRTSDSFTISATVTTPTILEPSSSYLVFNPPTLLFTPNVSSVSFKYTGIYINDNLGTNINPIVIGRGQYTPSNSVSYSPIYWYVREVGDPSTYQLSLPEIQGTQAVSVVPGTFIVKYSTLAIGSVGSVNITANVAPRSDVVLTLLGNNLNFDPPTLTFTPNSYSQVSAVSPAHFDYKDSDEIPFTVDYIISGTNYREFVPPPQTFLGVRQGTGNKAP